MKFNLTSFFTLAVFALFTCSSVQQLQAQTTKTFTTTGTWNTPGNWSPVGVPDPADIVVINAGVTLTVDVNATCDSLYFVAGASSSTVQLNSGVSLTVTNNVRFTDPTANSVTQLINVGAGTFTCNNITFANTSATTRIDRLTISTGTANINGNMVMEASAAAENQLVFSGAGKLNIGGAWTFTSATFTPSTGTVEYTSASAQNIRGTTYNKLILSGGTKTLANTAIVNDSLIIQSGSILDNSANVSLTTNSVLYLLGTYRESNTQGAVTFNGLIHIASGGTFQSTVGETFTITNSIRNDGTFTSGAGTYTFSTNAQQLSGTSAIAFTGAVTVTGITLTNNNASLTIGGNLTGTGTLVNSTGCTLTLNGGTNSITTLNATASGNTVVFSRAGTQTVPGTTYHHLTISSSSTKSLISDFTVNGTLTINSGPTLAVDRFLLTAGGSFATAGSTGGFLRVRNISSTPLPVGQTWAFTVNYDSAAAQTVVAGNYSNLNLTGGNRTLSSTGVIAISGTYTPGSGTFTVGTSTIEFNGSSSQTIPAASYYNLTSSSTGARTLASTGTIFIAGTFTPGSNTYTITGSTISYNGGADATIPNFTYQNLSVTDGFTKTLPGSLSLAGNLVLTSGKLAIGTNNTLTINGTVTSTATNCIVGGSNANLTFAGSGAATTFHLDQTVDGTTNRIETFTVNRSNITITMGNNMRVNTALVLTAGRIAPGANTLTINGTLTASTTGTISSNGSTSAVTFTGSGNATLFLDQTTAGTTNRLGTLTFNRNGNTLTLGNATQVASSLVITAGRVSINKQTLTINGTVTSDATNNITGGPGCLLAFGGSGDATFFLDQTTPGTTNRISTLTINRTGNTVSMGNNISLARVTLTAGRIGIGANTLTIDSIASYIFGAAMSASANISCNGSSNLNIVTSDNVALTNPTIFFDQTVDGTTNRLANFTLNLGGNTRSVTLGSNLQIATALTLTTGDLALGSNTLTLNGTLTSDANNLLIANGSSNLSFTNTGNATLFLDQTTAGTTNRLGTLTFNRSGNILTLGNSVQVNTSLVITAGRVSINKQTLTLNGTVTSDATNNITGGPGCLLAFGGSGNATFFLDQTTPGTTNRISTLTINRTGNTVNMGNSISLARITLTAGRIGIGSNTLTIDSISAYIFGAAMSATANISCNGSSNLSIITSDNANVTNPTLFFDQTTDGTTNRLANFTVALANNTRSLTLGNNLQVATALTLTTGDLNLGSTTLTINGTLTHDANNILVANGSSNLSFTGTGSLTLFLSQTTNGTTNRLGTLTFNRSGSVLTMGNSLQTATALVLTAGQLALGSNTLTINGTVTSSASNNFIANGSSLISYTGTGDVNLFMDQTTDGTTNRLATLTINRTGNTVTMGNNLRLARLVLTAGRIGIGSNTLTMSSTAANLFGAAMSTSANISCNGSSNLSITATDNAAVTNSTLFFDATTPGTTNRLGSFTINLGANTRTLTLGNDLQVNTALTLTRGDLVMANNTLTLNGTLTNDASNALVSGGAASIVIGGSGALGNSLFLDQTTPGTTNRLANLTYNRSSQTITLGNAIQVTGTVNPTAGTLSAGSFLTLISDATATACITAGSGSYISGTITVQRFVPAIARRFRFMSSPASSRTLADWQGEFFITGTGGSSNGFDASLNNSPTVYSYTESTSGTSDLGWTEATNITNTITTGRGYRVFVRGDRSDGGRLTETNLTQNAVTVNVVGSVNTGDIAMPVTFTNTGNGANDGWNLLGNPYPCHYDWNAFYDNGTNLTNIDPTIFIYDPNTNSYKSYNASSNVGDISGGIIPSGSAFFVHANAASPAITFRESFKVSTAPTALFKTGSTGNGLRIALIRDSINSDATFIKYMDEATEEFDLYDIEKLSGGVNISSMTDGGVSLTANCKPFNGSGDTIPLNLNIRNGGTYTFLFSGATDLISDKSVVLADKLTGTIVNLRNQERYTFETDMNNAATFGKDRFMVLVGTDVIPTGITEYNFNEAFDIYPTVVDETLHITRKSNKAVFDVVQVYDMGGRLLMEKNNPTPEAATFSCNMGELGTGVYLLKLVNSSNGAASVSRFVKQ